MRVHAAFSTGILMSESNLVSKLFFFRESVFGLEPLFSQPAMLLPVLKLGVAPAVARVASDAGLQPIGTDTVITNFPTMDSELAWGVVFYASGLIFLTLWEELVVPRLKLRSILPDIPLLPNQLSEAERSTSWILPWTANLPVPPPAYDELSSMDKFRVGRVNNVAQYITVHTPDRFITGVIEKSSEWSQFYKNETIIILKERIG